MNAWAARHPVAAAIGLSLALAGAFAAAMGPRYATNDDPLLAMLAAGRGFASAPDEHLVFVNALLGLALRGAYRAWPGVPWYALALLAIHAAAQAATLYAALRLGARPARWAACGVFLAVAAVPFANNLQFTVTAMVAAQAGMLLVLGALEEGTVPRGSAAAAAGLLVSSSLLRFEAFGLMLALAFPVVLVMAWRRPRRVAATAAAVVASSALVAAAAWALDRAHYARDPAWADYRAFNAALRPFVDFGRAADTPGTAEAFRRAGWSRNDHRLLLHWFHPDADVFGTAELRAVAARLPEPEGPLVRLRAAAARALANRAAWPMLLALPFAVASCAAAPRGRRALMAALAATAAALCWLAVFRKAPPHVYLPAMAWPLALAVVLPAGRPSSRAGRAAYAFAAVLAAVAAVRALAFQRAETVEGVARERAYVAALQPLRAAPDRVFVLWSTFPYQVAGPLRSGPWPFDRFLALGWPQRTPASARTLRALGYAGWWEALADPRVRLVAPVDAARWIEAYAARHRGLALTLAQEGSVPGFGVFRASIAPEAAAERVLRSAPAVPE